MSIDKINPYIIGYLEVAYSNQQVPEDPNSYLTFLTGLHFKSIFQQVNFGKELMLLKLFII